MLPERTVTAPGAHRQRGNAREERIPFSGSLGIAQANQIYGAIAAEHAAASRLIVDLEGVTQLGRVAEAAIVAACRVRVRRGDFIHIVGAQGLVSDIELALGTPEQDFEEAPPRLLEAVGLGTLTKVASAAALLQMAASSSAAALRFAFRRVHLPRHSLRYNIALMGADAVGIVGLLAALLGMILAFEATRQLGDLGAKALVPDVVGLSLIREFAPLMCAVVVIARNGAAIASELASMRAGQEVDALRTMGIDPVEYLVLPRALSLILTTPMLTIMAMAIGLLGAILVAILFAHLDLALFYYRLVEAVDLNDLVFGLSKSLVFATTTSLSAAAVGLSSGSSASDVGRATTHAVVLGIFLLVVCDALFTFFSGVSHGR